MTHIPVSHCLDCGEQLDAATHIGGDQHKPDPGDVSICVRCGHIMAFADDLTLRRLTDEEMKQVAGDRLIIKTRAAIAKVTGK
jgi:hypothetical protein